MVKSGGYSAKLWWKEHMPLRILWGLQICYTWLQGDKHPKMGSRSGNLDQHNGCE